MKINFQIYMIQIVNKMRFMSTIRIPVQSSIGGWDLYYKGKDKMEDNVQTNATTFWSNLQGKKYAASALACSQLFFSDDM